MHASAKFGRGCSRRIFYLEQDGPRFMKFLVDHEKIRGLTMDHFKREASRPVFGYTVTLMKDDVKNKAATALLWDANWMAQTSQLRVHNENGEVSFQISQLLDNRKFQITKISTYDEQLNRVHLTWARSKDVKAERARRANEGLVANIKNVFSINAENRWLYLGANSDSKKFLLFLLETYHKDFNNNPINRDETEVFSRAAAAAIPTIFQDLDEEGQTIVEEYLKERNTENAGTIRENT